VHAARWANRRQAQRPDSKNINFAFYVQKLSRIHFRLSS